MRGLSLVAASGGHSSSGCAGLSLSWPLLLQSTGSRCAGSVIVAHGPSCSAACGILPDQGSNPCPLHWQADSQPLSHQGRPGHTFSNLPPQEFSLQVERILALFCIFKTLRQRERQREGGRVSQATRAGRHLLRISQTQPLIFFKFLQWLQIYSFFKIYSESVLVI